MLVEFGHVLLFVVVQRKIFAPGDSPVTEVVEEFALPNTPVPEATVHRPTPTTGLFPTKVALELHKIWLGPAFAAEGGCSTVMVVLAIAVGQSGFVTVHLKTFAPILNPDTLVFGFAGLAIVPVPETTVQTPVFPVVGVFAVITAVKVLHSV